MDEPLELEPNAKLIVQIWATGWDTRSPKLITTYYNKALDKHQAVANIIEMKDADTFLEASGYAETFR